MAYTTLNTQAFSTGVETVTEQFQRLSTDEQLGLLWSAYTQLGKSLTPAAPGAARLQFAQGLIDEIKAMSQPEQMQAMREIAGKANTDVSRRYGLLTNNTKLAFWYVLGQFMEDGTVIPVPQSYRLRASALQVLNGLTRLEFNQQITVMRNMVVNMGVDPLF
ncbi:MAG: orange carotenoid protein N-terminal domain-containing protein [Cyanobacteria bacterium P01_G01_bin.54]